MGDSLLLILALCFHSVFEGIAIGVAGKMSVLSLALNLLFTAQIFPYQLAGRQFKVKLFWKSDGG